ncbi:hypothetical protein pb186bvf_004059 [Paramecium bursaria]
MKLSEQFIQKISQFDNLISPYDILSTKQGQEHFSYIVRNILEKAKDDNVKTVPTPINRQVRSSQSKSQFQTNIQPFQVSEELDQQQFINIVDEIMSDINEPKLLDLFQLLQQDDKVQLKYLYMFTLLIASKNFGQQFEFLYQFGDILFESLKQYNNKVLGLTLKVFMKIYGIDARQSLKLFQELKIKVNEEYQYDDFEVFCFAIFNPEQGQGYQQKFQKQGHYNKYKSEPKNK